MGKTFNLPTGEGAMGENYLESPAFLPLLQQRKFLETLLLNRSVNLLKQRNHILKRIYLHLGLSTQFEMCNDLVEYIKVGEPLETKMNHYSR